MKRLTCCLLLGLLPCLSVHAQYDGMSVDTLEQIRMHPPENERDLYFLYIELAYAYQSVDIEKALDYARQGVRLAGERKSPYWMAEFHFMEGQVLYHLGKPDSALYCFNKSLERQREAVEEGTEDKAENDQLSMNIFNAMAGIYAAQGNQDKAIEAYLHILPVADRKANESSVSTYGNLATTYFQMSNHKQAEYYYLKQKELAQTLKDSASIANANTGLSSILLARGEYAQALSYAEEAYRILLSEPQPSYGNLTNAAMRLSEIWMKIPDYDKAMEYAEATVSHARRTGFPSFLASALYTLSTAYLRQGKYAACEQAAFEALAADSTSIYVNSILYANIAQANIWMGNSAQAIEYFSKTLNSHRAYSNQNFQASLSEMEVRYETEKKELLITELEKEKRLMAWLGLSGIAILVLTLALFLFLWRWAVQKKRLAEQQIKQLEQEKQLVATQAVLEGETAERTRLARDLHDGLGSILTGVKLNLENIKPSVLQDKAHAEHFTNTLGMLNESIVELRRIAHHLMPDALTRYGLKRALSDFCDNFPAVGFDYFGSEKRLDSKLEIMIYRIIHELVNNALKHSGASQIVVQVMRETDYVAFIVRDNGSGFNVTSQTGGIGLRNIRDRVASFNGRMDVHSQPGEGTEINIELRVEN